MTNRSKYKRKGWNRVAHDLGTAGVKVLQIWVVETDQNTRERNGTEWIMIWVQLGLRFYGFGWQKQIKTQEREGSGIIKRDKW